jgi:hypothetical protein
MPGGRPRGKPWRSFIAGGWMDRPACPAAGKCTKPYGPSWNNHPRPRHEPQLPSLVHFPAAGQAGRSIQEVEDARGLEVVEAAWELGFNDLQASSIFHLLDGPASLSRSREMYQALWALLESRATRSHRALITLGECHIVKESHRWTISRSPA